MQLKTTATINIQSSKKWSGLKHHMEHDSNVNNSNNPSKSPSKRRDDDFGPDL